MNDKKLGRYITYLLRHCPESIGLHLDSYGYANVDELINKVNKTKDFHNSLNAEVLKRIVETDDKQRFSYDKTGTKIRAVQGHSFHVDVARESAPPDILYHGTSRIAYSIIKTEGIKKMSRDYVHLSKDIETATSVGLRHAKTKNNLALLVIDAKQMAKDGLKLYVAENGVWLADYVPPKYITIKENGYD